MGLFDLDVAEAGRGSLCVSLCCNFDRLYQGPNLYVNKLTGSNKKQSVPSTWYLCLEEVKDHTLGKCMEPNV